ncbi:MAG: 2-octaprenyl-6-methoxyphenyl hydroxylase [Oceanospirillaceae bacterium]|nr:2-octaprenyl-6-methoxyphenyl hydroxylase [Oceanospirillaceae bacterium]
MNRHYDIVIIGAGMVGASLAAMLLEHAKALDLQIAMIEPSVLQPKAPLDNYQPSFDARATALSHGSAQIFQQLSLWDKLQQRAQSIEHIHVSDRGHFGAARLHATAEKVVALGYVIENKWLGEVLFEHLEKHQNSGRLTQYSPAKVERINREHGLMHLAVTSGDETLGLTADLVVMADGARSALSAALGINYVEEPYHQSALVCNVEIDRVHKNTAYERFTDTGPMALLPLKDQDQQHRCGLIWTVAEDHIDALLALDDAAFLAKLQMRFGFRAGRFIKAGQRYSYPLKLLSAQEQVRAGLVIVGNAAHTLHPMAGQGFNLALRGVASLAEQLVVGANNKIALGDFSLLSQYQHSRLADQRNTIGFSDKSMKLFTSDNSLLALGRDIGLQLLDISPTAKTFFARSAMGLTSPMPILTRGADDAK